MRPGASSPRAKIPDMIEQFLSEALPAVLDYRLALAALAAMASALIRGYAGFGVAMMMVPSLSMLYGPIEAIAITIIPVRLYKSFTITNPSTIMIISIAVIIYICIICNIISREIF